MWVTFSSRASSAVHVPRVELSPPPCFPAASTTILVSIEGLVSSIYSILHANRGIISPGPPPARPPTPPTKRHLHFAAFWCPPRQKTDNTRGDPGTSRGDFLDFHTTLFHNSFSSYLFLKVNIDLADAENRTPDAKFRLEFSKKTKTTKPRKRALKNTK